MTGATAGDERRIADSEMESGEPVATRFSEQAVSDIDPTHLIALIGAEAGPESVRARAAGHLVRTGRLSDTGGSRGWLEAAGQGALAGAVAVALAMSPVRHAFTPVESIGSPSPLTMEAAAPAGPHRVAPATSRPPAPPPAATRVRQAGGPTPAGGRNADPVDDTAECGTRVAGAVTAEAAEQSVGDQLAVEFRVASTKDTGRVTFLNSRVPFEGRFYVAIFPDDYSAFPLPPAEFFDGACVVVQGRVELYRGAPQIVLRHSEDIVVVGQ